MKLIVEIELGNAAMQDGSHVCSAVGQSIMGQRAAFDPLQEGDGAPILDVNGNTVGAWRVEDGDSDVAYEAARIYTGSFPLSWLAAGERVQSAGDGTGACEIVSATGGSFFRVEVGDRVPDRGET